MLPFDHHSPTRFHFGPGREKETGAIAAKLGARRVLLHYGQNFVCQSGLLDTVKQSLSQAGLKVFELGGAKPNPRDGLVYEGIDFCRRHDIDTVIGLGGGSAVDSAKAIAIGACHDGDFWDFYGGGKKPDTRLRLGTIVTLPATGTEGSNSNVITQEKSLLKRGLRSPLNRPDFSILNPELTYTLPEWQLACGAADILSHAFERYFSKTEGVMLTDELCEGVMRTVLQSAPQAIADKTAYDPRANLMWASTMAHIGLLGLGREEDWSAHALEHELSALYDVAHGAGLAALYPAWLEYHLPHDPQRMARMAHRLFGLEEQRDPVATGQAGIHKLARFFRSMHLPLSLKELGVKRADLPRLAQKVKRQPDGSCGHYLPLQDPDILAIYEKAFDWTLPEN